MAVDPLPLASSPPPPPPPAAAGLGAPPQKPWLAQAEVAGPPAAALQSSPPVQELEGAVQKLRCVYIFVRLLKRKHFKK